MKLPEGMAKKGLSDLPDGMADTMLEMAQPYCMAQLSEIADQAKAKGGKIDSLSIAGALAGVFISGYLRAVQDHAKEAEHDPAFVNGDFVNAG